MASRPPSTFYNNGLELAFPGLAYKITDGHDHDTRQPAFQKTHTPPVPPHETTTRMQSLQWPVLRGG
jgi:hypothetical protein